MLHCWTIIADILILCGKEKKKDRYISTHYIIKWPQTKSWPFRHYFCLVLEPYKDVPFELARFHKVKWSRGFSIGLQSNSSSPHNVSSSGTKLLRLGVNVSNWTRPGRTWLVLFVVVLSWVLFSERSWTFVSFLTWNVWIICGQIITHTSVLCPESSVLEMIFRGKASKLLKRYWKNHTNLKIKNKPSVVGDIVTTPSTTLCLWTINALKNWVWTMNNGNISKACKQ